VLYWSGDCCGFCGEVCSPTPKLHSNLLNTEFTKQWLVLKYNNTWHDLTQAVHGTLQILHSSLLLTRWYNYKICITSISIYTCPASKTTCQYDNTVDCSWTVEDFWLQLGLKLYILTFTAHIHCIYHESFYCVVLTASNFFDFISDINIFPICFLVFHATVHLTQLSINYFDCYGKLNTCNTMTHYILICIPNFLISKVNVRT